MTRTTKPLPANNHGLDVLRNPLGWLAALVLLFACAGTYAQDAPGNTLQDIQVQSLPGQQVELRLILSGPAPEPLSFTIENPARIALDLPDTALGLSSRRRDVDLRMLDTVLTAEANGRTRVVLNLDSMVPYETRVSGNTVVLTLGEGGDMVAETTTFTGTPSTSPAAASGRRAIENVDFRRTREGGGRVIIDLTDPSTPVDIRQEGGRVVAVFKGTELPGELIRRLDVQDFATPVTTIDAVRVNNDARVLISADGDYEQLAYQSDDVFTIEINPVVEEEEQAASLFAEDKDYEGERVTLNFQDIETRAVLQLLAEISGRNIVVSDTVQGNVTLRLNSVPWDQALDIVLTTKGLDMRQNGNVIIVAPAEEIAAREKADLEAKQAIQELEPLFSEFLQVNYAKAGDLAALIKEGENSLLSDRGSVAIDERTNTLLVQDTVDRLRDVRRLVQTLDIPVRQVLIESRIVVVNDDFSRELGVRLGLTAVQENSSDGLFSVTGTSAGSDVITASALENLADTGQPFPVEAPAVNNRYNVNLPVNNPAGQIALAILDSDYIVDLELSALQAEGRGEIVSTPRVITANQKEALIEQGVEIPFQESSSSGATTTQFKKAVLSLTVTPQITPDDNIIMDLQVNSDSVGELVASATGGFVPSIDTREIRTQVLVRDGQTVVLGGIYETERREVANKVPLLGDIPGVGALFRSTQNVANKSELLIFVTPKILEENAVVY
ncbi:MAG TPA: type IV pilus secretin PilQ [Woeseiaceae bacterium]|nr:type IV pilus secretin PilQ [Woeseiaceae bacterium]